MKNNGVNSESFEIQVIGYRNYNAPSEEILEYCSFTANENDLTNFVHSLTPDYGWGNEAVEVAFKQLNHQEKKPNIVMLMADAPAQTRQEIKMKRKNRQISYGEKYWKAARDGFFTNFDWKKELGTFMTENVETNIFCFYLDHRAKRNFDEIAKIGNGKSMYLNVNDRKQSVNILQGALSETILYKIYNGQMDLVNKFRKQNRNIPTFL